MTLVALDLDGATLTSGLEEYYQAGTDAAALRLTLQTLCYDDLTGFSDGDDPGTSALWDDSANAEVKVDPGGLPAGRWIKLSGGALGWNRHVKTANAIPMHDMQEIYCEMFVEAWDGGATGNAYGGLMLSKADFASWSTGSADNIAAQFQSSGKMDVYNFVLGLGANISSEYYSGASVSLDTIQKMGFVFRDLPYPVNEATSDYMGYFLYNIDDNGDRLVGNSSSTYLRPIFPPSGGWAATTIHAGFASARDSDLYFGPLYYKAYSDSTETATVTAASVAGTWDFATFDVPIIVDGSRVATTDTTVLLDYQIDGGGWEDNGGAHYTVEQLQALGNQSASTSVQIRYQVTGDGSQKIELLRPMCNVEISTVSMAILVPELPNGEVGLAYSENLDVSNGTSPYSWSIISGSLPVGLSISSSTGVISGTPTTPGNYTFEVQVEDDNSDTSSMELEITISSASGNDITDGFKYL